MRSIQVLDVDIDTIYEERYDVSLFASGYESRCIYIPGLINPRMVTNPLVFGFTEESQTGKRDHQHLCHSSGWINLYIFYQW